MILALAGQFKQLSHEPEFLTFIENCLNCAASARIISSFDFKHRTSYNISFIIITISKFSNMIGHEQAGSLEVEYINLSNTPVAHLLGEKDIHFCEV